MEEVADIKDMFEKMDINNKGRITLEELKVGLHKIGHQIPDPDVQILMEAVSIRMTNSYAQEVPNQQIDIAWKQLLIRNRLLTHLIVLFQMHIRVKTPIIGILDFFFNWCWYI